MPIDENLKIEVRAITEETADALIKVFEALRETSSLEYIQQMRQRLEKAATNLVAKRLAYHEMRYIKAPWITRWYWKRKVADSEKAMRELAEIIRENNAGASDEK